MVREHREEQHRHEGPGEDTKRFERQLSPEKMQLVLLERLRRATSADHKVYTDLARRTLMTPGADAEARQNAENILAEIARISSEKRKSEKRDTRTVDQQMDDIVREADEIQKSMGPEAAAYFWKQKKRQHPDFPWMTKPEDTGEDATAAVPFQESARIPETPKHLTTQKTVIPRNEKTGGAGRVETLIPADDREASPMRESENDKLKQLALLYKGADYEARLELLATVDEEESKRFNEKLDALIWDVNQQELEEVRSLRRTNPEMARATLERMHGKDRAYLAWEAWMNETKQQPVVNPAKTSRAPLITMPQPILEETGITEVADIEVSKAAEEPVDDATELSRSAITPVTPRSVELVPEQQGMLDAYIDRAEVIRTERGDKVADDYLRTMRAAKPASSLPKTVEAFEESETDYFERIVGEFKLAKGDVEKRKALLKGVTDTKLQAAFEDIEEFEAEEVAEAERQRLRDVGHAELEKQLQGKKERRSGLVEWGVDMDVARVIYVKKGLEALHKYLQTEEVTDARTIERIVRTIQDDVLDYSGKTPVVRSNATKVVKEAAADVDEKTPSPELPSAMVVVDDDVLVEEPKEAAAEAPKEATPDVLVAPKDVKFDISAISPVDELLERKNLVPKSAEEVEKGVEDPDFVDRMSKYADRFLRKHFKGELVEEEGEKGPMGPTDYARALSSGAVSTAASMMGLKFPSELMLYLSQRHFVGIERERVKAAFAAEGEARYIGGEMDERKAKMRQSIESSKYLSEEKKTQLMLQLENIMDAHAETVEYCADREYDEAARLVNAFVEQRIKLVSVHKEAVNSVTMLMYLSGTWPVAGVARGVAIGTISFGERLGRVKRELARGERTGSFARNMFVSGFGETWRDLSGGDAKTRLGKMAKSASAIATIGRTLGVAAGIAGISVPDVARAADMRGQIERLMAALPDAGGDIAGALANEEGAELEGGEESGAIEEEEVDVSKQFEPEKMYGYGRPEGGNRMEEVAEQVAAGEEATPAEGGGAEVASAESAGDAERGYVYPPREEGIGGSEAPRPAPEVVETASMAGPVGSFEHEGRTIQFEYAPDGSLQGYDRADVMLGLDASEIEKVSRVFEGESPVKRGIVKVFAADLYVLRAMEESGRADTLEYVLVREKMVAALMSFEQQGVIQVDEQNSLVAKYFAAERVNVKELNVPTVAPEVTAPGLEVAGTAPESASAPPNVESAARLALGSMETIAVPPHGAVAFVRDDAGNILDLQMNMRLNPWDREEARTIVAVETDMKIREIPPGWAQARRAYGEELFTILEVAEVLKQEMGRDFGGSTERAFLKQEVARIQEEIERNWNGRLDLKITNPKVVRLLSI